MYVQNDPVNGVDTIGLVDIKIGGKIYRYLPNDHHGINPHEPHAHFSDSRNKIGIETGNVYDPKGKKIIGKINPKHLKKIRGVLKGLGYLGIALTAVETYEVITSKDAEAFENLLDYISNSPPELQEEILKDVLKNRPDLFYELKNSCE